MQLFLDRTGNVYLRSPKLEFDVSMLPVAKVYFERFLAEPSTLADSTYEEMLSVNPRASWKSPRAELDNLFVTGIHAEEARSFVEWLGDEYDLPTVEEWCSIEQTLGRMSPDFQSVCDQLTRINAHPATLAIVKRIHRERRSESWSELTCMRGGFLEWVTQDAGYCLLGAPLRSTLDPRRDPPVRVLGNQRRPEIGLRPIRRRRPAAEQRSVVHVF